MPIAWWFCFVKKQHQTRGNGSKKPIPSEGAAGLQVKGAWLFLLLSRDFESSVNVIIEVRPFHNLGQL